MVDGLNMVVKATVQGQCIGDLCSIYQDLFQSPTLRNRRVLQPTSINSQRFVGEIRIGSRPIHRDDRRLEDGKSPTCTCPVGGAKGGPSVTETEDMIQQMIVDEFGIGFSGRVFILYDLPNTLPSISPAPTPIASSDPTGMPTVSNAPSPPPSELPTILPTASPGPSAVPSSAPTGMPVTTSGNRSNGTTSRRKSDLQLRVSLFIGQKALNFGFLSEWL